MKSRILVAILAGGALVLGMAGPAHAESTSGACEGRGPIFGTHRLDLSGYYTVEGANHRWTDIGYSIGGAHTGGKSNVNAWLYSNGSVVWNRNSPDDREHSVPYFEPIGVTINAANQEWVSFQGIFDVAGPDPSCSASTGRV